MTIRDYEVIGNWRQCAFGKTASATKDDESYSLDMYTSCIATLHNAIHDELFDADVIALRQMRFDRFVEQKQA